MPLTPADVHNVAFNKPPIGKRGYDEEEVDAFLDEVERELVRLSEENDLLRGELDRNGGPIDRSGGPAGPSRDDLIELRNHLERAHHQKAEAEQAARAMRAEIDQIRAQNAAPGAMDHNEQTRVLMMAQRTADDHLADARREAEMLMTEARTKAEETFAKAQAAAHALESEARERHEEAVNGIDTRRAELQARLEEWVKFARDYRAMLTAHVDQQLNGLRSGEIFPRDLGIPVGVDASAVDQEATSGRG